jgi:hypothetical protein
VILLVAAIILVAFFLIGGMAKKGLPDYSKNISLSGLLEPVTVYRDSLAILTFMQPMNTIYTW